MPHALGMVKPLVKPRVMHQNQVTVIKLIKSLQTNISVIVSRVLFRII